jgi:Spy/CpxP family protein refolding chaperone
MRVRGVVAFSLVLLAAAVGLATAGGSLGAAAAAATSQIAAKAPDGPPPGPPPGPRGGPGARLIDKVFELDPTADQLSQIKTLRETERESSAAYKETVRSVGKELQTAIQADTFDEDAVRVLAQEEATATIELRVIGARTDAAVYKLLTADQKAALAKLSERKGPPPPSQKAK